MVRLLHNKHNKHRLKPLSFNPTMVRLLPECWVIFCRRLLLFQSHNGAIAAFQSCQLLTHSPAFQSHNGAIAAKSCEGGIRDVHEFQSHNGAIAAAVSMNSRARLICFNPTMVRLLLALC